MIDFPMQEIIVQEHVSVQIQKTSFELSETDLSFYNTLAGGMCSGEGSSGPTRSKPGAKKSA